MKVLQRIDVISAAKIGGLLYFFISLIFILPFALFMGSMGAAMGDENPMIPFMGIGAIFIPIIYGVMGFIVTAIATWAYNVIAGWVGGVRIRLEDEETE